jgi:hypothetical protein
MGLYFLYLNIQFAPQRRLPVIAAEFEFAPPLEMTA